MNRFQGKFWTGLLAVLLASRIFTSEAQIIQVPNGSFESPGTSFADPRIDDWQKTPKPVWFDESQGGSWDQLTGVFKNTDAGASDHIDNMDASQGVFLFALPEAGLFQDYDSIFGTNNSPNHKFDAVFEPGKEYDLTVAVLGGGGGMKPGVSLELALYYRDASSNMVIVASSTITNSTDLFPTNTHFTDFNVRLPQVQATDAWAGQRVGVALLSTVGFDLQGGYWDLDNVRLSASHPVPNGSFELPETVFADPGIDEWQKTAKPDWFDESQGGMWDQLTGVFLNTAPGASDHIDNVEGKQAAFFFAVPEVGLFQDYDSISGTNATPGHAFNVTYTPGESYDLTVAVVGGGGGMKEGVTLELGLYYRDANSNMVLIAQTIVTNSAQMFPTTTHLTDFSVHLPAVQPSDPWAGQHAGIAILSTVGFELQGGYWDLDNVRLAISGNGGLAVKSEKVPEGLKLSWPSQTGISYQLRASEDLKSWTDAQAPVSGTGEELSATINTSAAPFQFYIVSATPQP
jgi:hypothetical protein